MVVLVATSFISNIKMRSDMSSGVVITKQKKKKRMKKEEKEEEGKFGFILNCHGLYIHLDKQHMNQVLIVILPAIIYGY